MRRSRSLLPTPEPGSSGVAWGGEARRPVFRPSLEGGVRPPVGLGQLPRPLGTGDDPSRSSRPWSPARSSDTRFSSSPSDLSSFDLGYQAMRVTWYEHLFGTVW